MKPVWKLSLVLFVSGFVGCGPAEKRKKSESPRKPELEVTSPSAVDSNLDYKYVFEKAREWSDDRDTFVYREGFQKNDGAAVIVLLKGSMDAFLHRLVLGQTRETAVQLSGLEDGESKMVDGIKALRVRPEQKYMHQITENNGAIERVWEKARIELGNLGDTLRISGL